MRERRPVYCAMHACHRPAPCTFGMFTVYVFASRVCACVCVCLDERGGYAVAALGIAALGLALYRLSATLVASGPWALLCGLFPWSTPW